MTKRTFSMRKVGSILLNAGLMVVVFLAASAWVSRNMLPTDRQVAPELQGVTLAGEPYSLAEASNKPALVYFFAPWCKICAASSGNLTRLRRWRDVDDLEIVAVALDWGLAREVREYVDRHELNVTVVLGDVNVSRQWQIQAFPSYYVLDDQHRIVRRDVGYSTQLGLWLRALSI